jgi:quinol monooxygenase YgiN
MIISSLRLVPSPRRHPEVLEIMRSVAGPTGCQKGCLACHIYEEDGPEQAVVFCAHWKSQSALREHICSDLYLRILAACEIANRAPEFSFHRVTRTTRGMDLVQRTRGRAARQPHASIL